jgi:hypothetical protein
MQGARNASGWRSGAYGEAPRDEVRATGGSVCGGYPAPPGALRWLEEVPSTGESPGIPENLGETSSYKTETLHNRTEPLNTCASVDAHEGVDPAPIDPQKETQSATREERRLFKLQQDAWFEEWWAVYWLKKSRKRARDAFGKHVRTEERFRQVLDATAAQAVEMLTREPHHRPHGATWLNGERWEDDTTPEPATKRDAQSSAIDEAVRQIYGGQ